MVEIKEEILKEEYENAEDEEKHIICSKEKEIVEECKDIIERHKKEFKNEREEKKKTIELFHLLVLLKKYNIDIEVETIEPNEPGDFILKDKNGNQHLVEIFTIFGDQKEYNLINTNISKLLESKENEIEEVNGTYSDISIRQLVDSLKKKNRMHFNGGKIKSTILLVITTESDLCAVTGTWIEKYARNEIKDLINDKTFDHIYAVDYYASGCDGLEIAFDVREWVKNYIEIMDYE